MRIRDKLNKMLIEFECLNLGAETARQALIDCIIDIVQKEPVDPKYWNIKDHPLAQYEAIVDDDGNVIRMSDTWYKNNIKKDEIQQEQDLAQVDVRVDDEGNVIRRDTEDVVHPD